MSYMQTTFKNLMEWVDQRLPVTETYEKHMSKYYAPKNFNFWYFFGVLSFVVLVNQLLTGIWLIPEAKRTNLDSGDVDLRLPDGGRFLWLSAALGQHVLLGRSGYCLSVWSYSCGW